MTNRNSNSFFINDHHPPAITALRRMACWLCLPLCLLLALGCGTTTQRVATEQLLMSDAVDRAIESIDFSHLEGQKVYLDTIYLQSVKGNALVNSEYVISSLRQQLTAARCLVQESRDDATIVVEPRMGALGTDGHEVVYGIPQSGAISTAASVLTSSPLVSIPEISVGKNNAQSGIAKIIVFAYNRDSREPIWQSGIAKAESTSKDTWILGAGPFQRGSIYKGMRFAGKKLDSHVAPSNAQPAQAEVAESDSEVVSFDHEYSFVEQAEEAPTEAVISEHPLLPHPNQVPDTAKEGTVKPLQDNKVSATSYEETVNEESVNDDPLRKSPIPMKP